MKKREHPNRGSTLDSFLEAEGIKKKVDAQATKEVMTWKSKLRRQDKKNESVRSGNKKTRRLKTTPFDSARYLTTDEAIAFYLKEALSSNDPAFIAFAKQQAARAKTMNKK